MMEPDAGSEVRQGDDNGRALASIAISLKRIADVIEGNGKDRQSLTDAVCTAIEQGIVNAARMRG